MGGYIFPEIALAESEVPFHRLRVAVVGGKACGKEEVGLAGNQVFTGLLMGAGLIDEASKWPGKEAGLQRPGWSAFQDLLEDNICLFFVERGRSEIYVWAESPVEHLVSTRRHYPDGDGITGVASQDPQGNSTGLKAGIVHLWAVLVIEVPSTGGGEEFCNIHAGMKAGKAGKIEGGQTIGFGSRCVG